MNMNMLRLEVMKFGVLGIVLGASCIAFAGRELKFNGATEADFATPYTTADSGQPYWKGSGKDCNCKEPGLVMVTGNVGYCYYFEFGSVLGTTIRFVSPNGQMTENSQLGPGNAANTLGIVDIQLGATFSGTFYVGVDGLGIVTNSGTWIKRGNMELGYNPTGHGIFHQNGTVENKYPKQMNVGLAGWGELFVNKPMEWTFNDHGSGDIVVGQSQFTNRIVISEDGSLAAHYVYLGGREAGHAGRGELQLHGGTYSNYRDNGEHDVLFYVGACPDGSGSGVDVMSYGAIRGWGVFTAPNSSRLRARGIYVRLGQGEIVGDGEGVEGRSLDLGETIYQVVNAIPDTTLTTSGWRAVNRGRVTLSRANSFGNEVGATNVCVGCEPTLGRPNLVNAVKIYGSAMPRSCGKSFGATLLASDCAEAHANALPRRTVNVLSVHRLGVFTNLSREAPLAIQSYKADFRYDQTAIRFGDSRIELLRYQEDTGRWTVLTKLGHGVRPADCILSMPDYISDQDAAEETYTLGTYAIVETRSTGAAVILR